MENLNIATEMNMIFDVVWNWAGQMALSEEKLFESLWKARFVDELG